ncbi:MAG: hypothetical protein PWR07_2316, partial [Bacillota bacterium]|nr:hypothetical protein [Bacillota bacterium]
CSMKPWPMPGLPHSATGDDFSGTGDVTLGRLLQADAARWSREDQGTCIGGILGTSFVRDLVPGDPACVVFESEAKRGGPHGIRINAKLVPQG